MKVINIKLSLLENAKLFADIASRYPFDVDLRVGRYVVDGKSVPEGDCENCLSCVHNCPTKAILIIRRDPEPDEPNPKSRYRNPNVQLGEIIKANSQINFNK